jgi:O-antigen/teichoic acid export membrane protein
MNILKGASVAFVLKIFSSLASLCLNYIIAKSFVPELAGDFFIVLTVIFVFGQISRFGTDNYLVKQISQTRAPMEAKTIVSSCLFAVWILSLVFSLLVYLTANQIGCFFSSSSIGTVLRYSSICICCYALSNSISFVFQGMKKVVLYIIGINLLQVFFTCIAVIVLLSLPEIQSEVVLGCSLLIGFSISLIVQVFFFSKYKVFSFKNINLNAAYNSFKLTFPLLLMAIFQLISVWSGQIIIGKYLTGADVASYTIAHRIAMLTSFILVAVNSIVAPTLARFHSEGNIQGIRDTVQGVSVLSIIAATPIVLLLMIYPSLFLSVFGEHYKEASFVLVILAVGQWFNVATGCVGYVLQMCSYYKTIMVLNFMACLFSILSGILLVSSIGKEGAAYSNAATVILLNIFSVLLVKKYLGFYSISLNVKKLKYVLAKV